MQAAFLVAPEGIEQVELTRPWKAVTDASGGPTLVSTRTGKVQAFNHLDKADTFPVDLTVDEATAADFDGLVLPGGVANPDALRLDERAVAFVKSFFDAGKPVAAICHAPWTLIEADVVRGRTLTSWPSLRTDLRNAGAHLGRRTGPDLHQRTEHPDHQPEAGRSGGLLRGVHLRVLALRPAGRPRAAALRPEHHRRLRRQPQHAVRTGYPGLRPARQRPQPRPAARTAAVPVRAVADHRDGGRGVPREIDRHP